MRIYAYLGLALALTAAFSGYTYWVYGSGKDAQKAEYALLEAEREKSEAKTVEEIAKVEIKERKGRRDKIKAIRQESDECSNTRAPESILTRLP